MSKLLIPVNHTSRPNTLKQNGKKKNKPQKVKNPIIQECRECSDHFEDYLEEQDL